MIQIDGSGHDRSFLLDGVKYNFIKSLVDLWVVYHYESLPGNDGISHYGFVLPQESEPRFVPISERTLRKGELHLSLVQCSGYNYGAIFRGLDGKTCYFSQFSKGSKPCVTLFRKIPDGKSYVILEKGKFVGFISEKQEVLRFRDENLFHTEL